MAVWFAGAKEHELGRAAYVAPVSVALVVLFFLAGGATGGLNLAAVLWRGVQAADPQIIQHGVFRAVFAVTSEDAQTNWRHHMVSGLLLGAFVSLMLRSYLFSRIGRLVSAIGVLCCVLLVVLSLSRAIMVAAALALVVVMCGLLIARSGQRARLLALGGAALCAGALLLTPLGDLVAARFFAQDQSASYEARFETLAAGAALIEKNLLVGGAATYERDMHNVVLQHWIGFGLIGLLAALNFVLLIILVASRLFILAVVKAGRANTALLLASALLALPFVRAFTAGGGLGGAEWLCIGVSIGVLTRSTPKSGQPLYPGLDVKPSGGTAR